MEIATRVDVYKKTAEIDSSPGYPRATEVSGKSSVDGLSLPITTRARGTNDGLNTESRTIPITSGDYRPQWDY